MAQQLGGNNTMSWIQAVEVCASGIYNGTCSGGLPLTGAVAISGRSDFACALMADGTAMCWGSTSFGKLGFGTPAGPERGIPTVVGGGTALTGIVSVATGVNHACAVLDTGRVKCWGFGMFGQLGHGVALDSNVPIDVCATGAWDGSKCDDLGTEDPLTGAVAVAAGTTRTCVVTDIGGAKCWGSGSLGDGNSSGSSNPVDVCASGAWDGTRCDDGGMASPLTGVLDVAVGDQHTCALMDDGGVKCWGDNASQAVGTNVLMAIYDLPVDVCASGAWNGSQCDDGGPSPFGGAVAISTGRDHTCAILDTSEARCWGSNANNRLGTGVMGGSEGLPVPMCESGAWNGTVCNGGAPMDEVIAVSAGEQHTCILRSDGGTSCVGDNDNRQSDPSTSAMNTVSWAEVVNNSAYRSCATVNLQ